MSNSEILQSFKIAFLSIGIVMLTGQVLATSWYEPTSTPPGENAPEPVNITSIDQDKLGPFESKGLYSYAGGYIQTGLNVGGEYPQESNLDNNTNLLVAGGLGINLDEVEIGSPLTIDVRGGTRVREFSSALNPGKNYPAPVCVQNTGDMTLC